MEEWEADRINNSKTVFVITTKNIILECYEDSNGLFGYWENGIFNIDNILHKADSLKKLEIKYPEYFIN
jgi:hypothetical protein